MCLSCFSQVKGGNYKLAFCASRSFRVIAPNYINPHKSVKEFKAAKPCDTSEKAPFCSVLPRLLFQLLHFKEHFQNP